MPMQADSLSLIYKLELILLSLRRLLGSLSLFATLILTFAPKRTMAIWTTIRSRCKSFTDRAVAYHKLDDGETKEVDRQKWESVSLSESIAISQHQVQSAKTLPVVLLFTSTVFFAMCLIFRALMRDYASIDMACTKKLSAWGMLIYLAMILMDSSC